MGSTKRLTASKQGKTMKTLSIVTVAITLSILSLGSFKPLMPKVGNRAPALEKTYKPLKLDVKAYLVSVSR